MTSSPSGSDEQLPLGDPERGKRLWLTRAAQCHSMKKDDNRMGPTLYGIIGSQAGKAEGFWYSEANLASDVVWTEQALSQFLENPRKYMPGTKMAFAGLKKPQDRADLIAYMKQAGGLKR
eukprot:NODE_3936_length_891_cov_26.270784_g3624_i0.p1 GENE.NODE_3936_length_891_cov_26.270784_g3624_i0~~NODE_3936_length_891_cov_26.270784_g3624_i0.p1  ORF type:complete len:120 (-),score=24.48 NODE_3936_length_891_cov_26.270784_g3624_i0:137-496(-)